MFIITLSIACEGVSSRYRASSSAGLGLNVGAFLDLSWHPGDAQIDFAQKDMYWKGIRQYIALLHERVFRI